MNVDHAGHILSQTASGASLEKALERVRLIATCMIRVRITTEPQAWAFLARAFRGFRGNINDGGDGWCVQGVRLFPFAAFWLSGREIARASGAPQSIFEAGKYSGETRKNFSGETRFFFLGNPEFLLGNFWVAPGQKELLHNPFSGKFPGISQKTFLVSGKSFTEEIFLRRPPLPRLGGRPEIRAIMLTRTVQKQPASGKKLAWEGAH